MPVTLEGQLVVAISSRALFDFEEENRLFETGDDRAYMKLQLDRLEQPAQPGVAFSLVKKLLAFNGTDAHRVVARENDHLDPLRVGVVEGQQLLHQRKRYPRLGGLLQTVQLQLHVSPVVTGLEEVVFFFEVEQRTRRNRDHQLTVKRYRHGESSPRTKQEKRQA